MLMLQQLKSMHVALQDLALDHLFVIYPGTMKFPIHEKITMCGLDVISDIKI